MVVFVVASLAEEAWNRPPDFIISTQIQPWATKAEREIALTSCSIGSLSAGLGISIRKQKRPNQSVGRKRATPGRLAHGRHRYGAGSPAFDPVWRPERPRERDATVTMMALMTAI